VNTNHPGAVFNDATSLFFSRVTFSGISQVSIDILKIFRHVVALATLEVATPTALPFQAAAAMLLPGEVMATAWLPTCDVISARQWSYPVSALSGVHLPGKTTVWRR